jgi:hypothetical protein
VLSWYLLHWLCYGMYVMCGKHLFLYICCNDMHGMQLRILLIGGIDDVLS